jgi:hypothetical protein
MGLLSFRALDRSDFPLSQRWLSEPHVDAWWHEPLDLERIEKNTGHASTALSRVMCS